MTTAQLNKSAIGSIIAALFAAPCVGGLVLFPLGLVATFGLSGALVFLNEYRYLLMAAALLLLGLMHWSARRAKVAQPTRILRVATALVVVLIGAELVVHPPWEPGAFYLPR